MTLDLASILGYIILPLISLIVFPLVKSKLDSQEERLKGLEEKARHLTTETQVRQLIIDKYDPLYLQLEDIKEKLDKLFDLYIEQSKNVGKLNG